MAKKKLKYAFGTSDTHCEADLFDTIEEVIEYAQASWDDKDGNPFDEDLDYTGCIYVGTADIYEPADFAPSLDDIADQMTDRFYSDHNIDDDKDVTYSKKEEAQKEWCEFINKYFDIPCTIIANWNVGIYDLKEHKWVERYDKKERTGQMKVKFAGRVYDVIDTRTLPGGLVQYGIEDEPGHIDWLINVEIMDDGNSGYGFKNSGASYPTKPVCFDTINEGEYEVPSGYRAISSEEGSKVTVEKIEAKED